MVKGYQSTSLAAWDSIQAHGFRASRNSWDWLGDGVYFWEGGEGRARQWATDVHGADGCIIEVDIDLDGCVDFQNPEWFRLLRDYHDEFVTLYKQTGLPLPVQSGKRHELDRFVVNHMIDQLVTAGIPVPSVRGLFPEGDPAFPGSAILSQSHIQIAVRDLSRVSITGIWKEGDGWTRFLEPGKP